ncbi:hypothetical protein SNEBB_006357, partial [Seison nebaliae]
MYYRTGFYLLGCHDKYESYHIYKVQIHNEIFLFDLSVKNLSLEKLRKLCFYTTVEETLISKLLE